MRVLVLAALILALACGSGSDESAASTPALQAPEPSPATSATPGATSSSGAWGTRAPLLEPNSETAVAELDDKIYVIGGYPSSRVVVSSVQVYDIARDTWQLTTPAGTAPPYDGRGRERAPLRHRGRDRRLRRNGRRRAKRRLCRLRLRVQPAAATWTRRAPMPTARSAGATAVIDGKIYVAGGRPPRGLDFAMYDPAADRWTALPDLPTQRNHLAASAIGGKVYVAGGRFGGGVGSEMTAALEVFDPRTNAWEKKASLPAPRAGLNGIAARGCFYTFGGEGNDADPRGIFEEMEVYNPQTDRWTELAPIPTPVHGVTGAAFVDGWIHLAGGGTLRGGSSGSTLHQIFRAKVSCT